MPLVFSVPAMPGALKDAGGRIRFHQGESNDLQRVLVDASAGREVG